MTSPTGNKNANPRAADGFTLIELMLVLTLLLIVIGVAFPSLQHFFRGRNLDSEARRFLSLTRYGQSRAVSEGVPMVLWIDARNRSYGLQMGAGYLDLDSKGVAFALDKDLQVEVSLPTVATAWHPGNQGALGVGNNLPMIHFSPDGSISEPSPDRILIRQSREDAVWIVQSANHLNYEIPASLSPAARR